MRRSTLQPFEFAGREWMLLSYAPARPGAFESLTASEVAVVDRWLEGRSTRAIATERAVALRTVANQLARAYEKLGVSSRAELLELVHRTSHRGDSKCESSGR